MQGLYNKLYMHLSTDMHTALNQLIAQAASKGNAPAGGKAEAGKGRAKAAEGPSRHQLAVLKGLADEAELTGDQAAADRYHQERILAPANAQVSYLHSASRLCVTSLSVACWVPTSACIYYLPFLLMLPLLQWEWKDRPSAVCTCAACRCPHHQRRSTDTSQDINAQELHSRRSMCR